MSVVRTLPQGTVTFLFTDIEGSTRLLHELGDRYAVALAEHRRVLRETFARHGGVEVDTQGDALFVAFTGAPEAVAAAVEAQAALEGGPVRVRMGVHTGEPLVTEEGYVGVDVHLAARVAGVAHGGQIVVTRRTRDLADAAVRDLGEHRVRDFDEPVWLFQAGEGEFPPLRTVANTNLPRPASSFVGREAEVGTVAGLLRSGARIVTLTGPGGTGKTRLAIESVKKVVGEFPHGVFWVSLAPLRDPGVVLEAVQRVVGTREELGRFFAGKQALLLLDNFEHLVGAAPALADLIERVGGLAAVVTSRELLRVRGEVEFPVAPLAAAEAVALMRARAAVDDDADVHTLCERLDNLPLAIELAAARARLFSPAQLLERLAGRLDLLRGGRDADPRQQTLRATIGWSYELLDRDEQRLFARLSVFAGGCTLASAAAVCDADDATLESLLDKSLVRRRDDPGGEPRFWMLETIREYAAERLDEAGEADRISRRHALYLVELGERRVAGAGEDESTIRMVGSELADLSAALGWSRAHDPELFVRLVAAYGDAWTFFERFREGAEWAGAAAAVLDASGGEPAATLGRVLQIRTGLLHLRGDNEAAVATGERAIAVARGAGDARTEALALNQLADAVHALGDRARALELYTRARDVALRADDRRDYAGALVNIACVFIELESFVAAREAAEDARAAFAAIGNKHGAAAALVALAQAEAGDRRADAARAALGAAIEIYEQPPRPRRLAACLTTLGAILVLEDAAADAARLLAAADAVHAAAESAPGATERVVRERALGSVAARLDARGLEAATHEGTALTLDAALALGLTPTQNRPGERVQGTVPSGTSRPR